MTMKQASIVTQGLTKTYHDEGRGTVLAVDSIEFQAHSGEIFGLLGPNGAGKTTTLRMLSTVLKPSKGNAWVMNCEIVREAEKVRRSLGFYSATTALYPRLTARETIEFFASINGYPKMKLKDRVEELVNRFGLNKYADTRIDRLSSGMKQKVSIARTVAHDPPVLIFDEPTVGLDVLAAIEMQQLIKQFREEGKCIILSTHIMSEAERLCDRIAVMASGSIYACDTLESLRRMTGQHYLEDIFLFLVKGSNGELN